MLQDLGSQEVWGFRLAGFQGAEDSNFSETRFSASDAGLKAKLPFCEAFGSPGMDRASKPQLPHHQGNVKTRSAGIR